MYSCRTLSMTKHYSRSTSWSVMEIIHEWMMWSSEVKVKDGPTVVNQQDHWTGQCSKGLWQMDMGTWVMTKGSMFRRPKYVLSQGSMFSWLNVPRSQYWSTRPSRLVSDTNNGWSRRITLWIYTTRPKYNHVIASLYSSIFVAYKTCVAFSYGDVIDCCVHQFELKMKKSH